MSRIGRAPIKMPQGVELKVEGNLITVKGPLGTLTQTYDNENIGITLADGVITVTRANELNTTKAKHGLYRALLQDMVIGVTAGYQKTLIINGVGWKATQNGKDITLNIGYSHPIEYKAVEGITLTCVSITEVTVKGINKELVGGEAAKIRALRKPEPYHGYGIRYSDEVIERKEGKTAGK